MTGTLTVHSRRHFQKRFDLLERALPAARGCEPVSPAEFQRWHLERSLHGMGAATEADLGAYLTFPRFQSGARRGALRSMLDRGEVTEDEGVRAPARGVGRTLDLAAVARAGPRRAASRRASPRVPSVALLG